MNRTGCSWSLRRVPGSGDHRPFGRLVFAAALTALLGTGLASTPFAQGQAPAEKPLAFEVVSIRPAPSSSRGDDDLAITPDGWHMGRGSLMAALLTAYVPTTSDAMMYTVSTLVGIPGWMQTELYNVDAKVPEPELAAWHQKANQPAMLRAMMQALLADRCKLVVHRGTKEVNVYMLVVGKGGSKLKPSMPGDPHPGGTPLPGGGEFLSNDGTGKALFFDAPVTALAVVLSNVAGRPVEDRTGLTGRYDMKFRRPQVGVPSAAADPANAPPSIFEVVEDLGLKLVPAKTSVETLVVDHVERPSEN